MKKANTRRRDGLLERTATINGKRVHFYGKTQKELNEKMITYKRRNDGSVTFGKIAERYFTDFVNNHPSSERSIKSHVNRLIDVFGNDPADKLTPKDFTIYFSTLSDLSRKTVSRCKSVANCIYNFGIIHFDLTNNPVHFRRIPTGLNKTKRKMPSASDLEKIRTRTDIPNSLIYLIALYTGLRRGELFALQYKDIDRENRIIHVTKSVYYDGNDPHIKTPKTETGIRDVIIPDPLFDLLPTGKPTDYIFGGSKLWTRRICERRIQNYRNAAGITATLHQMRHAYRTLLYNVGIDERLRMEFLGHADISTTRNIYTHITQRKRDTAADAINGYLSRKE